MIILILALLIFNIILIIYNHYKYKKLSYQINELFAKTEGLAAELFIRVEELNKKIFFR